MTNYRASSAIEITGSSSASSRAWGVLRTTLTTSGSITLDDSTTIKIESLAVGYPFPCYVKSVAVTAGSVYILA
jgi:hypothetical protein